jgi:hypothetical protein
MKWNWRWFQTAALAGLLALSAGCSGIHASRGISILDILLLKNDAPNPPPAQDPKPANAPAELLAQSN